MKSYLLIFLNSLGLIANTIAIIFVTRNIKNMHAALLHDWYEFLANMEPIIKKLEDK